MIYLVPEIKNGMVFKSSNFSMKAEVLRKDGNRADVKFTGIDGREWLETWLMEDIERGFRNGYYTDITEKVRINKSFDNYFI